MQEPIVPDLQKSRFLTGGVYCMTPLFGKVETFELLLWNILRNRNQNNFINNKKRK